MQLSQNSILIFMDPIDNNPSEPRANILGIPTIASKDKKQALN
jgi:hypothetical protein